MKFTSGLFAFRSAVIGRRIRLWVLGLTLGGGVGPLARGAYEGVVPPPTDAFGGRGPYAVVTETLPSPGWAGQVVTVLRPDGAPGRRPTWFFAHGFGGSDPIYYDELLRHLASHGSVVVFSPYPANVLRTAENYAIVFDGFTAAAERLADRIDVSRVVFGGHSYGAGAVPALALRAVRERGWGGNGLALMLLAPWFSYFVSDADLASFPAGTQAVVQVYEDDMINDHRMAIDVFTRLKLPAADKDYLMLRSDRIDGYNYNADHRVPTGVGNAANRSPFDALDVWGVHRLAQALTASALLGDPAGRAIALGNGSAEQVQMGATASGRALRPMFQTDAPVPLFPSSRYWQGFDGALNPRRGVTLPVGSRAPRLLNLSVRAYSSAPPEVLVVGATVTGDRPKSLLVRAVGPGLGAFGVVGAMPDPRLAIMRGSTGDIEIDDWNQTPNGEALAAATTEVGAFGLADGSKDAALLASFSRGSLTAQVPAVDGAPGVVLAELYEADQDASSRLINLSARARVGAGEEVLIAGFVIGGEGNLHVLIRGIGPALTDFGLAGAVPDPQLEIRRGSVPIATNDNWSAVAAEANDVAAAAAQVGAFPLGKGSADAAVLLTLPPGAYSAQVRSRDGRAGNGLVEVYVVP